MISLIKILDTLRSLEHESGDDPVKYVEAALEQLGYASEAMNTLSVRGRTAVDSLLGCMIGLDMIIGKEEDNG